MDLEALQVEKLEGKRRLQEMKKLSSLGADDACGDLFAEIDLEVTENENELYSVMVLVKQ